MSRVKKTVFHCSRPIAGIPEGFNSGEHKQLKREAFASPYWYWKYREKLALDEAQDAGAKAEAAKVLEEKRLHRAKALMEKAKAMQEKLEKSLS